MTSRIVFSKAVREDRRDITGYTLERFDIGRTRRRTSAHRKPAPICRVAGLHVLTGAPASSFLSGAREQRLGTPTGRGSLSRSPEFLAAVTTADFNVVVP